MKNTLAYQMVHHIFGILFIFLCLKNLYNDDLVWGVIFGIFAYFEARALYKMKYGPFEEEE